MPIVENARPPLTGTGCRSRSKAVKGVTGWPVPSRSFLPAQYAAPDAVTPQNTPLPAERDTNVGVSATMTGVVQVARAVSPTGPKVRSPQQYTAPDTTRPQVTAAPRLRLVNRCAPFTRSGVGLHGYGRPRVAQCSRSEERRVGKEGGARGGGARRSTRLHPGPLRCALPARLTTDVRVQDGRAGDAPGMTSA